MFLVTNTTLVQIKVYMSTLKKSIKAKWKPKHVISICNEFPLIFGWDLSWGKKKNTTLKIKFPNPTNQTHIKT